MKTKLLYGAVLVSSAMLVACGGSSSNEPDKGKPDPVEDKGPSITDPIDKNPIEKNDPPGDKEPSKIIDLTKTNKRLYVAAHFALDNSLFWEHFVGANPEMLAEKIEEEGYFEYCAPGELGIDTVLVFGENLAVYQCDGEMGVEGVFNVKGTKATGVKGDESQWLGYYSLSGDSDSTPYIYKGSVLSDAINAELFVEANHNSGAYESQRTYFVDMKQTETFGEYVRGQTLKLGASRVDPFKVSIIDNLYDIEGPISLALRNEDVECGFSINSLKTIEKPALDFKPIGEPLDPDELELVAVRGGKLNLDNSIIAFDNDGKNATVNGTSVDLDKIDELFSECGEES